MTFDGTRENHQRRCRRSEGKHGECRLQPHLPTLDMVNTTKGENHHITYLIKERQTQGEPGRSEETTSIKHRSNRSQWSRETNKLAITRAAITRAATHVPPRPTCVATRTRRKRRDPPPKSSRTAYTAPAPGTPPLQHQAGRAHLQQIRAPTTTTRYHSSLNTTTTKTKPIRTEPQLTTKKQSYGGAEHRPQELLPPRSDLEAI
ncbi:unnamed protein product [Eruca vesicaria subsp. sativa]|uniref:Uncharacterized protein n=1 Tax=Eruca vesicaria subsp. sativa TaxID=29727 RepID=A0ABC8LEG4_ERUVS|nr:unnamed protein product [Eruca vesicaria subsp. sativa]